MAVVMALSAMLIPQHAFSQKLVFDIVNAVRFIAHLKEAMTHTGQLGMLLQNGFKLEGSEVLRRVVGLNTALTNMERAYDDIKQAFGASSSSNFEEFVRTIGERADKGNDSARKLLNSAYEADAQVRKANEAYVGIMDKIPRVAGATEAAQATANAVAVVIQQNQALLALASAKAQDDAMRRAQETAQREANEKAVQEYIEKSQDAYSEMKAKGKTIGVK